MKKFNEEKFMEIFLKNFKDYYNYVRHPVVISLTTITIKTCRELKYAQWKNREIMNKLISDWWNSLPERDDSKYGKQIFGRNCHLSQSSGPTFISVGKSSVAGVKCMDLVSFW